MVKHGETVGSSKWIQDDPICFCWSDQKMAFAGLVLFQNVSTKNGMQRTRQISEWKVAKACQSMRAMWGHHSSCFCCSDVILVVLLFTQPKERVWGWMTWLYWLYYLYWNSPRLWVGCLNMFHANVCCYCGRRKISCINWLMATYIASE